jgi:trimeric autotransporter adhesin
MAGIFGGPGNDILIGGNGADVIRGEGNNDRLIGGGGDDNIDGGPGRDFLEGQDGNDILDGGSGVDQLFGGAGNDELIGTDAGDRLEGGTGDDRYVVFDTGVSVVETAGGGVDTVVQGVLGYTLPDQVENLELFSGIVGIGNALDNRITGNESGNTLQGLEGNDYLAGAGGDDDLQGGAGVDVLEGGAGNDVLDGGADDDVLEGGTGNDTLLGAQTGDWLDGGAGDDIYNVSNAFVRVIEAAGGGVDRVVASVSYTLADQVENLSLSSTADAVDGTGNALDNELTGNDAANTLQGLDGSDHLIGAAGKDTLDGGGGNDELQGGAGSDVMKGGTGDDLYFVSEVGDQVIEFADEGFEHVISTVDFTLPDNVENLVLNGGSVGIGNEGANSIGTNVGASVLKGLGGQDELNGGAGADLLDGGTGDDVMNGNGGNDLYIVDNEGDLIQEHGVGDIDTVQSTVSYALSANLEVLQLTGAGAIDGTGNELNNTLTGNSANNALSGGFGNDTLRGNAGADTLIGGAGNDSLDGGTGADVLRGGSGNDRYVVDNASDTIEENALEGIDSVLSSISHSLAAGVENLTLSGAAAINATGNTSHNILTGNSGQNVLSGGAGNDTLSGGSGADVLLGGAGNDSFAFDALDLSIAGTRYDGGAGSDALRFSGGGKLLDLTSLSDERAIGIEIVDLTGNGNNKLAFSANDLKALSDTDALRIDGNAGDVATIADAGWTPGADLSFGQNLYHTFFHAGATLLIDSDVTAAFA